MTTKTSTLRFAAIQMTPELGNVDANLRKALALVQEAIAAEAEWIVLPEFFTTGMAFDDSLLNGHQPLDGEPVKRLQSVATQSGVTIGGSFLAESQSHVYNTFVLVTPDGQVFSHDKDFPSGPIEHAYYAGAEDAEFLRLLRERGIDISDRSIPARATNNASGQFVTNNARIGVALCWEMIRHRTVARLRSKVDVVLGCSAWPTIDPDVGFPGMTRDEVIQLNTTLVHMVQQAPRQLAELLGVPVIHANLVGPVRSTKLFDRTVDVVTRFCGDSRIVDCHGRTLARRSSDEGEGILVSDVALEHAEPLELNRDAFWIPDMPPMLQSLWYDQGAVGRRYYLDHVCPYRQERAVGAAPSRFRKGD
ncbi:MAG: carbon-nitrogen hydrolase family protein [Pirellulaceae bacterium]